MSRYTLADTLLARRIERAAVSELCAWIDDARATGVYPGAASFRVAGGAAVWFAPGMVVNGSFGLGVDRPVEQEEVAAMIAFFAEHGMPAKTDVCPHADPSLLRWLAEARFVATSFETVLYQPLPAFDPAPAAPGVEVRIASTEEERAVWADLDAKSMRMRVATPADHELARAISKRSDAAPFIGYLEGEPVGTGMLTFAEGIAFFNGDSTLPSARNRGVQSSILAERLRYAHARGCDLAVIEATPGGTSQRNQLRSGFRIAYTRVTLERPSRP
jgi:GNAT superfamily N-acetyltransferase